MYKLISKLLVYRNIPESSILYKISDITKQIDNGDSNENIISDIYNQINRLLELATAYGFNGNLWQNYLAYLLAMTETPFSLCCEKAQAGNGSVNMLVLGDMKIFKELFHYDFTKIEEKLNINCFNIITNYTALPKPDRFYNRNVSERVRELADAIAGADNENAVFDIVTDFYRDYGVGMFGMNKAFRIKPGSDCELEPITNTQEIRLSDLVGYEIQKQELTANTEAFVSGKKANNVLLYGDAGTGKSTSIKAILNEYYDRGLRIIEIYKHQFEFLPKLIADIKNRNYRFIIYMDDLSFEENEVEYKYLKAVIEGGLEIRPDNILIYATSNRWHLIKETWADRKDIKVQEDVRHSDTMEEKLSLYDRFGVTINYSKPDQKNYFNIVTELARRNGITMSNEELINTARAWAMQHGGRSGRTAQQLINHLMARSN